MVSAMAPPALHTYTILGFIAEFFTYKKHGFASDIDVETPFACLKKYSPHGFDVRAIWGLSLDGRGARLRRLPGHNETGRLSRR